MIDAETVKELRLWVESFALDKYEAFALLFALLIVFLIFWRLPMILQHRAEIRAIERESQRKIKALELKIAREKERRSRSR